MTVSFIGGENRNAWRKLPICRKSLTNFITKRYSYIIEHLQYLRSSVKKVEFWECEWRVSPTEAMTMILPCRMSVLHCSMICKYFISIQIQSYWKRLQNCLIVDLNIAMVYCWLLENIFMHIQVVETFNNI
jgi:hypothetical protein